jgi:hypothetical protein
VVLYFSCIQDITKPQKRKGFFLFLFFYFFRLTRELARHLRSMLRKSFIFKHLRRAAGRAAVSR